RRSSRVEVNGEHARSALSTHLDRHDDFPHLLIRLEVTVRLGDLLQRERPRDHGLELTASEALINYLLVALEAQRMVPDLRRDPAADAPPLEPCRPMRMRRGLLAEPAVDEQNSALAHRRRELLDERPADRIEHDARPLASDDPSHGLDVILFLGRNHV